MEEKAVDKGRHNHYWDSRSKVRGKNFFVLHILLLVGSLALVGEVTGIDTNKEFIQQKVSNGTGDENLTLITGRKEIEAGESEMALDSTPSLVPKITKNLGTKYMRRIKGLLERKIGERLLSWASAELMKNITGLWSLGGKEAGRLKYNRDSLLGEDEGTKLAEEVEEAGNGERRNTEDDCTEENVLGGEESYKTQKSRAVGRKVRKVGKLSRGEFQNELAEAKREKNSNEISSLLNTKGGLGQGQVLSNEDKKRDGLRRFVKRFLGNVTDEKSRRKGGKDRIPMTKANNKNNEEIIERIQKKSGTLFQICHQHPSSLALIEIGYGLAGGKGFLCNLTASDSANLTSNKGLKSDFPIIQYTPQGRKHKGSYEDNRESDIQSENDSGKIPSSPRNISKSEEAGGTKENSRIAISSFFLPAKFHGKYKGNGETSGNMFQRRSDLVKETVHNADSGWKDTEKSKDMMNMIEIDLEITGTGEVKTGEEMPKEDVKCKGDGGTMSTEKISTETDIFGFESSHTSGAVNGRSVLGPGPSVAVTAAGIGIAMYVLARTYRYLAPIDVASFPFTDNNNQNQTTTTTTNNGNGTSTTTVSNTNGTTTTTTTNNNGTGSTNTTVTNPDGSTTITINFGNGTVTSTTNFGNGTTITTITTNPNNATTGGNTTLPGNPTLPGPGNGNSTGSSGSGNGNPTGSSGSVNQDRGASWYATSPVSPTTRGSGHSREGSVLQDYGTLPGTISELGDALHVGVYPGSGTSSGKPTLPGSGTSSESSSVRTSDAFSGNSKFKENWNIGENNATFFDKTVQRKSATPYHWTVPPSEDPQKNSAGRENSSTLSGNSRKGVEAKEGTPPQNSTRPTTKTLQEDPNEPERIEFTRESTAASRLSATLEHNRLESTKTQQPTSKTASTNQTTPSQETSPALYSNESMDVAESAELDIGRNKSLSHESNKGVNTTTIEDAHTESMGNIFNAVGTRVNAGLDSKIRDGESSNLSHRPGGSTDNSGISKSALSGIWNITRNGGEKTIQNTSIPSSSHRRLLFQNIRKQFEVLESKIRGRLISLRKFFRLFPS